MYEVKRLESDPPRASDKEFTEAAGVKSTDEPPADDYCGRIMEDLSALLRQTIEGDIIPRLMVSHSGAGSWPAEQRAQGWSPSPRQVERFAAIVLNDTEDSAILYIERLAEQGAPLEDIYLELLAPAARLLGEWWVEDKCHFVDVTIGLTRLQHLLHLLNAEFNGQAVADNVTGSALFSTTMGEQHTYGVLMLAEFFRRDGWTVCCDVSPDPAEASRLVGENWFDLVGLSLSRESLLDDLRDEIRNIREASKNPLVNIMVGGRVFIDNIGLVESVGADNFAFDARQAAAVAKKLVGLPRPRC